MHVIRHMLWVRGIVVEQWGLYLLLLLVLLVSHALHFLPAMVVFVYHLFK
jgi:hypothetical protein